MSDPEDRWPDGAWGRNPKEKPEGSAPCDDGVDVTLIRWMLSPTPTERLQAPQRHVNAVLGPRAAMRERTGRDREDEPPENEES
ncbi:MAG: hypothetical protein ACLFPR_10465 [Desulfococcaceae bacterium]